MRRALVALITTCLFSTFAVFAEHPRIDQEQPAVDNTGPTLAIGQTSTTIRSGQLLAQVFTPFFSGILTDVTIPVACEQYAKLIVSLQTVTSSGLPSGTVLATETMPVNTYPSYISPYSNVPAAGFRLVRFSIPAHIDAETQYAIVLGASGTCSIFAAPSGDPYTRGHAYYEGLSRFIGWVRLAPPNGPSDDLPFQIFVEAEPPVIR